MVRGGYKFSKLEIGLWVEKYACDTLTRVCSSVWDIHSDTQTQT